jgi:ribonuclease HI
MIVTITTDASFHPELKYGAYAFWAVSNEFKITKSGVFKQKCKNPDDAEMKCIINALKVVLYSHSGITKVIVNTDSMNSITVLTNDKKKQNMYMGGWRKFTEMRRIYSRMLHGQKNHCSVEFRHVKGHTLDGSSRSWVNDWCDQRAKSDLRAFIYRKTI